MNNRNKLSLKINQKWIKSVNKIEGQRNKKIRIRIMIKQVLNSQKIKINNHKYNQIKIKVNNKQKTLNL